MSVRLVDMQLVAQQAREAERLQQAQQQAQLQGQGNLAQQFQAEVQQLLKKPNRLEPKEEAKTEDGQLENRTRRYRPRKGDGRPSGGQLDLQA